MTSDDELRAQIEKTDQATKEMMKKFLEVSDAMELSRQQMIMAVIAAAGVIAGTAYGNRNNDDEELQYVGVHTRLFVDAMTLEFKNNHRYAVGTHAPKSKGHSNEQ